LIADKRRGVCRQHIQRVIHHQPAIAGGAEAAGIPRHSGAGAARVKNAPAPIIASAPIFPSTNIMNRDRINLQRNFSEEVRLPHRFSI